VRIVDITYTPVKGLGLLHPAQVELTPSGAANDRRFFLADKRLQMVNGKRYGQLVQVKPDFDPLEGRLSLRFPTGDVVSDVVEAGEAVQTSFFGRIRPGRLVRGPWNAALSAWVGEELRLVDSADASVGVDRGVAGGVSLGSLASLDRLAEALQVETVDAGRFRMLFWVDELAAHAEDDLVDQTVALGEAVVQFRGHVGRCLVTAQNPATGRPDLDTLGGLKTYRDPAQTTAPLALGVWGAVSSSGRVRLGDTVEVRAAAA
jgi:uncharacterized protein YcbX